MTEKKNLSKIDLQNWNDYLKNPHDISDKDSKNSNIENKIKRFRFDLHGYSLKAANDKVHEIVNTCLKKRFQEILFITGKGIHSRSDNVYESDKYSKLKYSVPEFLKSNSDLNKSILKIEVASDQDGGEGAILVKLKIL